MKKILSLLLVLAMMLSVSTMLSFADQPRTMTDAGTGITLTNVVRMRRAVYFGYYYFETEDDFEDVYCGDDSEYEGYVIFDGEKGVPVYYVEEGAQISNAPGKEVPGQMLMRQSSKIETGSYPFSEIPNITVNRFAEDDQETQLAGKLSGVGTERVSGLEDYTDDSMLYVSDGPLTLTEGCWCETRPMGSTGLLIIVVPKAAAEAQPAPAKKFSDVPAGSWYEAPVAWALANKITDGTSATTFSPLKECTRAHVLTFLWRAAGEPEAIPGIETLFYNDMTAGQYYCDPISWAVQNAIVEGVEPHTFGVNKPISRGEFVTYLWKAAGCPEPKSMANPFTDVPAGSAFEKAVLWAKEQGVTDGTSATTFSPDNICTRAHVVTFLSRAYGK